MGNLAARPNARSIVTRCRIPAATRTAAQLVPERAERLDGATPIQLDRVFDPFAKPVCLPRSGPRGCL